MAAYVIFESQILDPSRLQEYTRLSGPSIVQHGGRFLARGGAITPLEGGWHPQRMVIVEFDTVEQAKAWWDSPEYAKAREARQDFMVLKGLIIDGV